MRILSVAISAPDSSAMYWRISNVGRLLEANGHEVEYVNYVRRPVSPGADRPHHRSVVTSPAGVWLAHRKLVAKGDYDVVYANAHRATFLSLAGKGTGVPIVYDMHGDFPAELMLEYDDRPSIKGRAKLTYERGVQYMNTRLSSKILCVSPRMVDRLRQKGVPYEKMSYVTNGVDLDFFRPMMGEEVDGLRRQLHLDGKMVFGYIGAFQKYQGAEGFQDMASTFQGEEVAFLCVGGDRSMQKGRCTYLPAVPRPSMPSYYSICDVLVLPRPKHIATEVAAPTKFAEYAAMGKPILTTKVGYASDLVERYRCGIVVPDNSAKNLDQGVRMFQQLSPEERKAMGENARRMAEKEFDWNLIGRELCKAIDSVGAS